MSNEMYNKKLKKILIKQRDFTATLVSIIIVLACMLCDVAITKDIYAIVFAPFLCPMAALIVCNIFQRIWEKERR